MGVGFALNCDVWSLFICAGTVESYIGDALGADELWGGGEWCCGTYVIKII